MVVRRRRGGALKRINFGELCIGDTFQMYASQRHEGVFMGEWYVYVNEEEIIP